MSDTLLRFSRRSAATVASILAVCAFSTVCSAGQKTSELIPVPVTGQTVVVDCVGDSITWGSGSSTGAANYPSLLGDLLGRGYSVLNFGEPGATALKNGDMPFWKRGGYQKSAEASPNVVVLMLGTNDSKPWNWDKKSQFAGDYAALISYYSNLPTHPQVFVCTPPPVPGSGNYGINEPSVSEELPMIRQDADAAGDPVIDVQTGMPGDSKFFVDNVHPNDNGYVKLAEYIYTALTQAPVIEPVAGRTFTGSSTATIIPPNTLVTVHFTTDGSEPTRHSPIYTAPIAINVQTTIKARAFNGKKGAGEIATAVFTLATP